MVKHSDKINLDKQKLDLEKQKLEAQVTIADKKNATDKYKADKMASRPKSTSK